MKLLKKDAINHAIDNFPDLSNKDIAQRTGCSHGYVCQVRSSRKNGLDKKPGLIRRILNWLRG
jgi:hypothetical protein